MSTAPRFTPGEIANPRSMNSRTTSCNHSCESSFVSIDGVTVRGGSPMTCANYIPLTGGVFAYLALLMDRYSRRIVAWHLGEDMQEELVLQVLRTAIRTRRPGASLIHHTDRGGQYAGTDYRAVLRRANIRQSMSRPDNCYDNAFMESCFGTLKRELEMTEYENQRVASREIAEFIRYYNHDRKHSALEYLKPAQFESLITPPK
jgi:putative transposase